ncbi:putative benzoate 4-monooxygenase cytochrome P450 [Rosellinia necatrix]|uniref:Putative benzoate 4-monooxygenase cytochrome P450 n=1 Tax=Rosellinia necatrix TaxID=77044 RepID=A0A1W2TG48_ROSNE|nr:putative benzoate 4-monooxygenase cytochrome P450 [Rosellinia necatrix]
MNQGLDFTRPSLVWLLLGTSVITVLILFLKQCVFHPLAKYPGPFLGRWTDLYAGYHAWRGSLHTDIYRCHQKYGQYVRYSPNRLLIDTNVASQDIHSHKANTIKSRAYQALVHSAPNTLTIRHKDDHARRRRILSQAFSDARILSYERIVRRHIDALCDNLGPGAEKLEAASRGDADRNMSLLGDWFTFDVMSEVIFGMKYNALKEPKYRYVPQVIQDSNIRVSTLVQAYGLTLGRLDRHLFPASIRARNSFLGFLGRLLKSRATASFTDNGNVFSFLETAKDPDGGETLSKSEIRAECATLVVAGSDTSSSALAATLFYLSRNARAYKRLSDEIRNTFATIEDISLGPQLNSCVYLRACIDEAMRLSPPVGGSLWREVGPGGMTVDGIYIPQGVDVGVGIYSLHHNAKYHKDPFNYVPERWIVGEGGSTKESVELGRSAFTPFSSGPRGCIGKSFAYHEITLTMALILHRFDFHSSSNDGSRVMTVNGHDQFLLKDHITGAKEGPYICFTSRQ